MEIDLRAEAEISKMTSFYLRTAAEGATREASEGLSQISISPHITEALQNALLISPHPAPAAFREAFISELSKARLTTGAGDYDASTDTGASDSESSGSGFGAASLALGASGRPIGVAQRACDRANTGGCGSGAQASEVVTRSGAEDGTPVAVSRSEEGGGERKDDVLVEGDWIRVVVEDNAVRGRQLLLDLDL